MSRRNWWVGCGTAAWAAGGRPRATSNKPARRRVNAFIISDLSDCRPVLAPAGEEVLGYPTDFLAATSVRSRPLEMQAVHVWFQRRQEDSGCRRKERPVRLVPQEGAT
ncbi:hypothetical protein OF001_U40286 [Pseudomonas sp. OF001]|nr:hypothetical protein OF001_U40286 [Pseudomonas sp. OF001]